MSDLDKEIRELSDRVQHTRYQFLKTELQTCLTALEMAQFELSIGNTTVVQREIAAVEKGVSVIQRFLSALPQDQRVEMDTNLAELNAILESPEQLARSHGDSVVAIHLTDVPFGHILQKPDDPSTAETKLFKHNDEWLQKEGAYALIQSSKPQSLAQGLNDSPAGLAAWLVEKFRAWSDCGGDIESRFTKDELLTQIMIYWATQSIGPSFLTYYDFANAGALTWIKEGMKKWTGSTKVPAAFALFPADISRPPREWAERFFNVQRWTEMPRGGHFAALEEPELLAEDIRTWFRPFREGRPI